MNYQRYDEGINFFQNQLSRSPNNLKLYPDLGEFYFLNNNKIEAKTIWSNGLNKFKLFKCWPELSKNTSPCKVFPWFG